jgi:hypothetical protein
LVRRSRFVLTDLEQKENMAVLPVRAADQLQSPTRQFLLAGASTGAFRRVFPETV